MSNLGSSRLCWQQRRRSHQTRFQNRTATGIPAVTLLMTWPLLAVLRRLAFCFKREVVVVKETPNWSIFSLLVIQSTIFQHVSQCEAEAVVGKLTMSTKSLKRSSTGTADKAGSIQIIWNAAWPSWHGTAAETWAEAEELKLPLAELISKLSVLLGRDWVILIGWLSLTAVFRIPQCNTVYTMQQLESSVWLSLGDWMWGVSNVWKHTSASFPEQGRSRV